MPVSPVSNSGPVPAEGVGDPRTSRGDDADAPQDRGTTGGSAPAAGPAASAEMNAGGWPTTTPMQPSRTSGPVFMMPVTIVTPGAMPAAPNGPVQPEKPLEPVEQKPGEKPGIVRRAAQAVCYALVGANVVGAGYAFCFEKGLVSWNPGLSLHGTGLGFTAAALGSAAVLAVVGRLLGGGKA